MKRTLSYGEIAEVSLELSLLLHAGVGTGDALYLLGEDVLVSRNVRFINWSDHFEEAGLDPAVHLYDGGHLNQAGAKIFSAWTGERLLEMGYAPREQTEENAAAWKAAAEYWMGRGS